jgi:voltage-gated potassium channel
MRGCVCQPLLLAGAEQHQGGGTKRPGLLYNRKLPMDPIKLRLRIFSVLLAVLLVIGTIGFAQVEGLSSLDAVYFTIVTLGTVGYGDIHPKTPEGKVLAIFVITLGVGTFVAFFASIADLLLSRREKRLRAEKVHMVIEIFYGEVGTDLLSRFTAVDGGLRDMTSTLLVGTGWSETDFQKAARQLSSFRYEVDIHRIDLESLRGFLRDNTTLFLRILENPHLLEHERFADVVRAVLHLKEELIHRESFAHLPETDLDHLAGDVRRAYRLLTAQWLEYMGYLKRNYPYLFSLAVRLNPFDVHRSPVVGAVRESLREAHVKTN